MRSISFLCLSLLTTPLVAGGLSSDRHSASFMGALDTHEATPVAEQTVTLTAAQFDILTRASVGEPVAFPALDLGLAKGAPMTFRAVELMAPGARIRVVSAAGERVLKDRGLRPMIGRSKTGAAGLLLDPTARTVGGLLVDGDESYRVSSVPADRGAVEVRLVNLRQSIADTDFQCQSDDAHPGAALDPFTALSSHGPLAKGALVYQTTVAVDTDRAFTGQQRFAGDPDRVMTYIAELFTAMNAISERDLGLHLRLGEVILNYQDDPYLGAAGLSAFSEYWRLRRTEVARDFALVLAGIDGGFRGQAWVNAYCHSGFRSGGLTFGSYSFNGIGESMDTSRAALFVIHELGHNLGSSHTHCERLAEGGTAFVDQCYSCEKNEGGNCSSECYVGPTMCQAGGTGSIMSYCHAGPAGFDNEGPAMGTTQNCTSTGAFHPLIADKLRTRMAANYPSCIDDYGGGFEVQASAQRVEVCKPGDATVNFGVDPEDGFVGQVDLAVSGLPAGVSGEFIPTRIGIADEARLRLEAQESAEDGLYPLTIHAGSAVASDEEMIDMWVLSAPTGPPQPTQPVNAGDLARDGALTWDALPEVLLYRIDIATDAEFRDVVESQVITGTSYTPTRLSLDRTYFWRVLANATCGAAAPSATHAFTTAPEYCASAVVPVGATSQVTSALRLEQVGSLTDLDISLRLDTTFPDAYDITLRHVATGTSVRLVDKLFEAGCHGQTLSSYDIRFDDAAETSLLEACLGQKLDDGIAVLPDQPLGAFDALELPADWELHLDNRGGVSGTLLEWCALPAIVSGANHILEVTIEGLGSVVSAPGGLVCDRGSCSAEFGPGLITLVPTSDPRGHFLGWSGDCEGAHTCTVNMRSTRAVVASFHIDEVIARDGFEAAEP